MSFPLVEHQWINDGTAQDERFPPALDPSFFQIDARGTAELLAFMSKTAESLRLDATHLWSDLLSPQAVANPVRLSDWQTLLDLSAERSDMPPHLALMVVFLRLYRHAQTQLNALTGAHLDHHFRQVLGFTPEPAQPDQVVVFPALAKAQFEHKLPIGTLFNGGIDGAGAARVYRTDCERIVTHASVARLSAIRYVKRQEEGGGDYIFVSPVADSLDGLGKPFADPASPAWPAFGAAQDSGSRAPAGVAISARILASAASRGILSISVDKDLSFGWVAFVSGKDGWIRLPVRPKRFGMTIPLPDDLPALVPVDPKKHGDALPTAWPAIKLFPVNFGDLRTWDEMTKVTITSISVLVPDDQSIKLISDAGLVDTSRPFQPFGSMPEGNAKSRIEWPILSSPWEGTPTVSVTLSGSDVPEALVGQVANGVFTFAISDDQNQGLFGSYLESLAKYRLDLIAYFDKEPASRTGPMPTRPDAPKLTSMQCTVSLSETLVATADDSPTPLLNDFAVFHLLPFGLQNVIGQPLLLPPLAAENSLFIGLADAQPGQSVALHFNGLEGTSTSPPEDRLMLWSALTWDGWEPIVKDDVTGDVDTLLIASSVVTVPLPESATDQNTVMPLGMHWLRLTVPGTADWPCQLAGVRAQAVPATLVIGDRVPLHLQAETRAALPPSSIKALSMRDAAISSVEQPFASTGGCPAESAQGLYTRASERLRHRNRAVSAWDFERLLLSEFPMIGKALCVQNPEIGEVTLVVVPSVALTSEWSADAPPKVSDALLQAMSKALSRRVTGMTTVSVINAKYEPLQVNCEVNYREGKSQEFYARQLNGELQRFLTPWAYSQRGALRFGSRLHQSVVQAFIASRDYVQSFTRFKLFYKNSHVAEAIAGPTSVLISAAEHQVAPNWQ